MIVRAVAVAIVALLVGDGVALLTADQAGAQGRGLVDTFDGPDRLVTNERGRRDPQVPVDRVWEATSGSLFVRDQAAWSGRPDDRSPDVRSETSTNSAVLRVRTRRKDFGDVRMSLRLRNDGLSTTASTPAQDFDGVSLMLRYVSPERLYYANVNRRDGVIAIKKKTRDYVTLAQGIQPVPYGEWQDIAFEARNVGERAVRLTLEIGGRVVLTAVDDGSRGGPALWRPGRAGIRGDNATFAFDDVRLTPVP